MLALFSFEGIKKKERKERKGGYKTVGSVCETILIKL